ncbi:endonuclease/exonuclease/phosphatase family protein [Amycolatopsis suaedae]|uniref:Endonuclease/exonuclease/phosphatase family protein n=1 Tax=Amycolatopsis suaedae TaxID=2510978 RepID=A0A4Q7J2I9_9PSEU|nr:endonuclease/exonuclease/phosphatase family protein [Amycolatopsis suaedae]RZQ61660.1 endonuclease/exonuclease/phosphatase family protein [Amycolatopsis suaedae]
MLDQEQVAEPVVRRRNPLVTGLLVVIAVPFVVLVLLRLLGIDGNRYTAAALALVPYATVGGLLLGVVALVLRRWKTGALVLLLAGALVLTLLPRMSADEQPAVNGRPLKVMAANLYFSQADPATVVRLVRDNGVEVLTLLELSPQGEAALEKAGLFTLLPHRVSKAAAAGAGSAVVSKYPLTEAPLAGPSALKQPGARVEFGDGTGVEIVAVHPLPPVESMDDWRTTLKGLPKPTGDLPVRILAGDFNATLDHEVFRDVLDGGYADAADERGMGLSATWPEGLFPPPVTLDHILVDDRVAVRDFKVFELPNGDHSAVYAELTVPV